MGKLDQMMFAVPSELLKFIGPEVPRDLRLNAARGVLPLAPKDQVTAVYALSREPDDELVNLAKAALVNMPASLLGPVLGDQSMHPLILDFFARNLPQESENQEVIALNKATDDETIAFQAALTNKKIVDVISNNQIRILRSTKIVDRLSENPLTSAAVLDRIIKFLELETKSYKKVEPKPGAGQGIEVEVEEVSEQAQGPEPGPASDEEVGPVTMGGEVAENAWASLTYAPDLLTEKEYENKEEKEADEQNMSKKIQGMSMSQKIKLALVGNLSARSILIRDSNKLVSSAVMKSPRLTDSEIEMISKSRSVSDDVIRTIAGSKEWTKNYQIKLNLVGNSKTPVHESMRLLNFLREKDLGNVARSKNVPQPICIAAKKLIQAREDAGKKKKEKK